MKKLLLLIAFLGVFGGAFADVSTATSEDTDDHITISDLTVVPGSTDEYELQVSLVGSRIYTAYEMDLTLPSGLEVIMEDKNLCVYICNDDKLYGKRGTTHTISSSFGQAGTNVLRLSCFDGNNKELLDTSGKILTIMLKTTPYLKPGKDEIKVTNCHFITNGAVDGKEFNGKQYNCPDQTLYVNVEPRSTATISVSAKHQWGSCVVPFDIPELPNGLEAYSLAGDAEDGTYAVLKRETSIEAYTPYFLYAKNGFTAEFSGSVDETKYKELVSKGELYGAIVPITINNGFVLQNQGDGAKLYSIDSSGAAFNIPAGKCFAYYYSGNTSKTIDLKFDDPTGINAVETSSKVLSDKPVYSLDGVRVGTPQPGRVYVVDGRKVLWLK